MLDISQFELLWADEFTELKLSDASTRGDANWCTKTLTPPNGGPGFEFLGANSGVFEKVSKGDSDSVLEIKMRRDAAGNLESGLICSHFNDRSSAAGMTSPVGYYEARLWLPDAIAGVWPAFWFMSANRFNAGRTRTAELDVMEWYGPVFPDHRYSTVAHEWRDGAQKGHDETWTRRIPGPNVVQSGFHTYGLEIGADKKQTYFFDRKPYWELSPDTGLFYGGSWAETIGDHPLQCIINLSCSAGAGWSVDPELARSKPASLWVDYVSFYRRVTTAEAQIAAQIADLNTQITTLKAQIAQLNSRVWNRDTTIRTLNEQINKLQAQIAALNAAQASFKTSVGAEVTDIGVAIADLQTQLGQLQQLTSA